jgi:lysozyme
MAFENNALGIDVSLWQRDLDWAALKKAGVSFAFAKATEADNVTDPYFAKNWPAIKAAGIVRGAYHFFRPAKDPLKQAVFFTSTVKLEQGDLPLVLDIESSGGLMPADLVKVAKVFLDEVERISGRKPIIYTGPNFWNTSMAVPEAPAWTKNYLLWIANYTTGQRPLVPKGWTNWAIWQYTDQGRLPGYAGNLDLDRYAGTVDDLIAWAGAAPKVTPPETPSTPTPSAQPAQPAPGGADEAKTVITNYVQALNARDFDGLAALYAPTGVRIGASGTVQGPQAIQAWYVDWLNKQFPGGSFTLGAISTINPTTWSFLWTCHTAKGDAKGQDTVGLQGGKLQYHATNLV